LDTHVNGAVNFLEALSVHCPRARFFYAASSHVFGHPEAPVQNELTPFKPVSVYGITKAAGVEACRFYRREHGVFASVGILYNHESPFRRPDFVSQKTVRAAVRIRHGSQERLVVGDLSARIDWGWAPDYVEAMVRVLELSQPDDFVIATGGSHTVLEFVQEAFGALGLDWSEHVEEDRSVIRRGPVSLAGDASKLHQETGWRPTTTFPQIVRKLVESENQRFLQAGALQS
jgi:GDPmannose 4,6-dehydratase